MTLIDFATPLIARDALFGNPEKTAARISPDGRYLTWLAPAGGVLNIWLAPIDDLAQARPLTRDTDCGIHFYDWTYNGHILYQQDIAGNENFHIYAVDPVSEAVRNLTPFDGVTARIESTSRLVRDRILVGLNRRDRRYFDLYLLTMKTGDLELVEQNTCFERFVTDDLYRPRFAVHLTDNGTLEIHRRVDLGDWMSWIAFAAEDAKTSRPLHLSADGTSLYMLDSRGRDTAALNKIDLADESTSLLAADCRFDLCGMIVDGRTQEPIAYAVQAERLTHIALTRDIEPDIDFLNGSGLGDWRITSQSEDDSVWLVSSNSDVEPPRTGLYDRRRRTLHTLFEHRPALSGLPLAQMRPVTIRSRDGMDLVSYLTRPRGATGPGPLVLLMHGGPWARDFFGFDAEHQWFANRGYSVLSTNFRGSMGALLKMEWVMGLTRHAG
jgi:dipeptidyl aminopeptidase/acylaminoacyl peptidase